MVTKLKLQSTLVFLKDVNFKGTTFGLKSHSLQNFPENFSFRLKIG